MPHFNSIDLLWQALAVFLLIGAGAGMMLALLLLCQPQWVTRISGVANRWVSMHFISQTLDRSVNIQRWVYRHHSVLGWLISLGSGYILWYFSLRFDHTAVLQSLAIYFPSIAFLDVLLQAVKLFFIGCAPVALVIGVLVWLRPSLLKPVEARSDRWLSFRCTRPAVNVARYDIDAIVLRHAQTTGYALLLSSLGLFYLMLRA